MTKRVLLLVEGQTEERFVKAVLAPALAHLALQLDPKILTTKLIKRGASFKGGVTSFAKFERDVQRLLAGSGGCLVTTIID